MVMIHLIRKALSSKTVAEYGTRIPPCKAFRKPGVVKKTSIYDPPTFPC